MYTHMLAYNEQRHIETHVRSFAARRPQTPRKSRGRRKLLLLVLVIYIKTYS